MEYTALEAFQTILSELLEKASAINPMRSIASGILDTSGVDHIWSRMIASNGAVYCLSNIPEAYTSVTFHETIDTMCQQLLDNYKSARRAVFVRPVDFPDTDGESVDVQLQV